MKLYYSDTLAPRKVCAAAKYLGAPLEYQYLDLVKGEHKAPAYLAINPNGKVPALVDGKLNLWESDAISLRHLAQAAGSDLWPSGAAQVEVQRWLSWNAYHFYRRAGELYFQYIIKPRFNIGAPDPSAVAEAQKEFRTCATILNAHLKGRQWLAGDRLSVADFSVAVPLPYAKASQMPLDEFPEMRRWHEQLNELPAWRDPFPVAARHLAAA